MDQTQSNVYVAEDIISCIALHLQCNYSSMLIYTVASDYLLFILDLLHCIISGVPSKCLRLNQDKKPTNHYKTNTRSTINQPVPCKRLVKGVAFDL